jgi:hypothetical protein
MCQSWTWNARCVMLQRNFTSKNVSSNPKKFKLVLCKTQTNHRGIRTSNRSFQFSWHIQNVKLLRGILLVVKVTENLK